MQATKEIGDTEVGEQHERKGDYAEDMIEYCEPIITTMAFSSNPREVNENSIDEHGD